MSDLEDCLQQYLETALWSSTDSDGNPLDNVFDESGVDAATKKEMLRDCSKFMQKNKDLLDESGLSASDIGHNFWLSRNGHGAGFFDKGLGEVGKKLQKAAKDFGSYDLIVGDDGYIHGSGGHHVPDHYSQASLLDVLASKLEKLKP